MKIKKILICGGHLSPAIAVIEELQKSAEYQLFYTGRVHALEGDNSFSLEYRTINSLSIPFYPIITGRLERHFGISFFISLMKIPIGFIQAGYYLLKIQPDVIVSFGGYVSFPIGIVGYLCNIPLIVHEQTEVMGLSNRVLSRLSDITYLSFDETKYVPHGITTKVIGIPKRRYDESLVKKEILNFGNKKLPLIFISGGSIGSRSINSLIQNVLPKLVSKYRIIHQCGEAKESIDYKLLQIEKKKLSSQVSENYNVFTNCNYHTFFYIMNSCDLVIGRSGANTVSDLSHLNKKSIFIPLPWSGGNEQMHNARRFIKEHTGIILEQQDITAEKLLSSIEKILHTESNNKENKLAEDKTNAASYIEQMIHSL